MRRRTLEWCAVALAGFALITSVSLVGLAAKERDNTFCVACHLHEEKFKRFTSVPFTDLTGPHYAKDVRCIDCHGGADLAMRLRVWSQAALDTGKFLAGRYREPDHMKVQLRPKECTQCHTPILKRPPALTAEQEEALEGRAGGAYHAIRPHDAVRITCVRCHSSHTTDSDPKAQFITRKRVEPICRECHATLGE
ncbi:MAG TPA: cytochrome c3 family protein [Methylomirabilota bacterium]|nr:cytochrome c3 family protein [Methylomirabilota bacterium]